MNVIEDPGLAAKRWRSFRHARPDLAVWNTVLFLFSLRSSEVMREFGRQIDGSQLDDRIIGEDAGVEALVNSWVGVGRANTSTKKEKTWAQDRC